MPTESTSAAMTGSPKQGDRMPFAALNREDVVDSGDDTPLSELTMGLGKRDRTTHSPMKGDQSEDAVRPSRRMVCRNIYQFLPAEEGGLAEDGGAEIRDTNHCDQLRDK